MAENAPYVEPEWHVCACCRPAIWRVMHQAAGMVDAILLGDQSNDAWRVGVTIVGHGDDGPEVEATVVYPCRTCGWADACDGECHS